MPITDRSSLDDEIFEMDNSAPAGDCRLLASGEWRPTVASGDIGYHGYGVDQKLQNIKLMW